MNWLGRAERRFGDWAMPQLSTFIVAMNAAVYVLSTIRPEFLDVLALEPALVLRGEVWRVFTFLFIPPAMAPVWMLFWLYLLFVYARALEQEWGDFRFNVYYGLGAAATAAASLATGSGLSNVPLNTSIFLAFAALYPDFQLLLFFILPVKVRWLAWLAWAGLAWTFLVGGWRLRVGLAAGLFPYFLFFGSKHWQDLKFWLQVRRNRRRYRDAFKDH